jgi:hypothetical protein
MVLHDILQKANLYMNRLMNRVGARPGWTDVHTAYVAGYQQCQRDIDNKPSRKKYSWEIEEESKSSLSDEPIEERVELPLTDRDKDQLIKRYQSYVDVLKGRLSRLAKRQAIFERSYRELQKRFLNRPKEENQEPDEELIAARCHIKSLQNAIETERKSKEVQRKIIEDLRAEKRDEETRKAYVGSRVRSIERALISIKNHLNLAQDETEI